MIRLSVFVGEINVFIIHPLTVIQCLGQTAVICLTSDVSGICFDVCRLVDGVFCLPEFSMDIFDTVRLCRSLFLSIS